MVISIFYIGTIRLGLIAHLRAEGNILLWLLSLLLWRHFGTCDGLELQSKVFEVLKLEVDFMVRTAKLREILSEVAQAPP